MPSEWFYAVDGSKHGPVSSKELTDLARSGKLLPTALVWKEGMDGWKPAGKVKGLFPVATTAPPPPPAPPAPASPPDIASAAKGLFGAVTSAAKRIGSKVAEAAKQPPETAGTNQEAKSAPGTPDEYPPQPDTPAEQTAFPKLSRRTAVVAGVAGGVLLLSCVVCGVIGSLVGPGSVNKPLTSEEQKHVEKFGPKPTRSSYDGSVEEVKAYLAKSLNDPGSVEYVEWYPVVMKEDGWRVIVKYRAKNIFGGVITKEQRFTIQNSRVVDTSE
ncbi:MAG: DUF4339 domain-containing protein [Gemmataceae bacterium]|nr:DUF4339 domain-containing protein [Gemmataceae bacterium]